MYDDRDGEYICLSSGTHHRAFLEVSQPARALAVADPCACWPWSPVPPDSNRWTWAWNDNGWSSGRSDRRRFGGTDVAGRTDLARSATGHAPDPQAVACLSFRRPRRLRSH
ncbi:MAG: hypothetical protein R3A10_13085 [Caldilineaceae bacterium]